MAMILIHCSVGTLSAQTFEEFFKQKKTQKKYLLEQIAALQTYAELAKKGYAIVSGGLSFIGDIKNGKFSLDKAYFDGLHRANDMEEITDKPAICQKMYAGIRQLYLNVHTSIQSPYLATGDKNYIHGV